MVGAMRSRCPGAWYRKGLASLMSARGLPGSAPRPNEVAASTSRRTRAGARWANSWARPRGAGPALMPGPSSEDVAPRRGVEGWEVVVTGVLGRGAFVPRASLQPPEPVIPPAPGMLACRLEPLLGRAGDVVVGQVPGL